MRNKIIKKISEILSRDFTSFFFSVIPLFMFLWFTADVQELEWKAFGIIGIIGSVYYLLTNNWKAPLSFVFSNVVVLYCVGFLGIQFASILEETTEMILMMTLATYYTTLGLFYILSKRTKGAFWFSSLSAIIYGIITFYFGIHFFNKENVLLYLFLIFTIIVVLIGTVLYMIKEKKEGAKIVKE